LVESGWASLQRFGLSDDDAMVFVVVSAYTLATCRELRRGFMFMKRDNLERGKQGEDFKISAKMLNEFQICWPKSCDINNNRVKE
jgi:hypothetical protein